jgi:hypothetical protein
MEILRPIEAQIIKHRDRAAECVCLWWAFGWVDWTETSDSVPTSLKAMGLVMAGISLSRKWDTSRPYWPQFYRRTPVYAGISAAVSAVAYFWKSPGPAFYLFIPLWIGLMAAWYLGIQLFTGASTEGDSGADHPSRQNPDGRWGNSALIEKITARNASGRYDVILGEILILATLGFLGWRLLPGEWPAPLGFCAVIGVWLVVRLTLGPTLPNELKPALVRFSVCLAAIGGSGWVWFLVTGMPVGRFQIVVLIYASALLAAYWYALTRGSERTKVSVAENIRWILLGIVWVVLFHPFFQAGRHGAGDAVWYATMLADMVTQVRAGVFPVFAGQSVYQFNGAIYSLRVAPAFHYLGALVDTATLRALPFFSIQNLLLALVGLAAIGTSYVTLAKLLHRERWSAFSLTVLFIACPGVIGVVFNTDLFMSWMTVPFLPLVFYGVIRSYERDDFTAAVLVGGSLGFMWWGHSPIALWTTLIAGITLGLRHVLRPPSSSAFIKSVVGCVVFSLVAAYPILSVLAFPVEPGAKMASFQVANGAVVASFLKDVFPAVLLPVSAIGRQLSDFQLGYSLWLLFGFSLWRWRGLRGFDFRAFIVASGALVLLLTPIPWLNLTLWNLMPSTLRNVTSNWAMNRLYLILAGLLTYSGALALRASLGAKTLRRSTYYPIVALFCCWSLSEAAKFGKDGPGFWTRTNSSSELRPENSMITSFAYLMFPKPPDYFSHGVTDPQLENRLLSKSALQLEVSNSRSVAAAATNGVRAHFTENLEFVPAPAGEEKSLVTNHSIVLVPGRRYLAEFSFSAPEKASGILEITGKNFFRNYAIPEYGGSRSFGVGADHSNLMPLWTSGNASETIAFRLRRDPEPEDVNDLLPFGSLRLIEYDPEMLPIKVESWIPYRARVTSTDSAWLETPRMYQKAYLARVDGNPSEIRKSPNGLAMIAVPAGTSHVELDLRTPIALQGVFWMSFLTIIGLIGLAVWRFVFGAHHPQHPQESRA